MAPFYARLDFWLLFAAWLPYTLFVLLYTTRSPWYASALGRSLVLSKLVIAVLLSSSLLTQVFGDYPGRLAVRVFLFAGAITAGWYQLIVLVRLQRQARRCPEEAP